MQIKGSTSRIMFMKQGVWVNEENLLSVQWVGSPSSKSSFSLQGLAQFSAQNGHLV